MGSDPDPIPAGAMGTVRFVDSLGTTFVAWDNGRRLGLLPDTDTYVIVGGLHPGGIPDELPATPPTARAPPRRAP